MNSTEEFYKKNIEKYKEENSKLSIKLNIVGWIRLVLVFICIVIDYFLYKRNMINLMIGLTILLFSIFLLFVIYHNKLFESKKRADILTKINENGIKRMLGEFKNFNDNGAEYLDENHPYANDLDVFGRNSIFQYINETVTYGGRNKLVNVLKREKLYNKKEIIERQKAIHELGKKVTWRQKIIVEGILNKSENMDLSDFIMWSKEKKLGSILKVLIACTFILITMFSVILVIKGVIPESFIILNLIINFAVLKIMSKNSLKELKLFEKVKYAIEGYRRILSLIEAEEFDSSYLESFKNKLIKDKLSCKAEMKKLSNILDWAGNSAYNAYYLLLNIFLFSDIFLIFNLERWRQVSGDRIEEWFDVMHEIDSLNSISNISFENEDWIYPTIVSENEIEGINIGHPLLGKKSVKNTFLLKREKKVSLITGSNMSGKSTFLRTLGTNLVLTYIGAPVYAEKFSCGIMDIYTCMRTKDNLEENISSFYAEIMRIKMLIEASKSGKRIFFLLDEIFKGTNSKDRHTGAVVLIKQLIRYGGVGLISTHDLELCDMEKENENIINYNFREFYEEDKIKFDYILRTGRSETQNAIHLMKLAGIDV